jgi:hypothetical protein
MAGMPKQRRGLLELIGGDDTERDRSQRDGRNHCGQRPTRPAASGMVIVDVAFPRALLPADRPCDSERRRPN